MKKLLPLATLLLLFFFGNSLYAQTAAATHVAIIPFTSTGPAGVSAANLVQSEVASCFASKDRFYLLDRGVTEKLKNELDAAKEKGSVYAQVVAEQGHLANAEYIITGIVDPIDIEESDSRNLLSRTTIVQYHGILHLLLEINAVESGKVIYSQPIIVTSADFTSRTGSSIMTNALCKLKSRVQIEVRSLFPPIMTIVKVEAEKKGLPEKILINAGTQMFDNGNATTICPGDKDINNMTLSKLGGGLFTHKLKVDLISIEEINAGGKTYKHNNVVGELRIESVDDDLAVCTVLSGGKFIKDSMAGGAPLYVKLKKE